MIINTKYFVPTNTLGSGHSATFRMRMNWMFVVHLQLIHSLSYHAWPDLSTFKWSDTSGTLKLKAKIVCVIVLL